MYILYGGRFTRALIVEMVLAECGIDYKLREIDIVADEHRQPAYLAINPAGWVPSLITPSGEVLYETPALSLYLAEQHSRGALVPDFDDPDRGFFLSGLFYIHDELEPILKRYFYPHRYVVHEADTDTVKSRALDAALGCVAVIEQRLARRGPYHLGERFTLVDLVFGYWLPLIEFLDVLGPYPRVQACLDRVRARPALGTFFERQEQWRDEYAQLQARGQGVK